MADNIPVDENGVVTDPELAARIRASILKQNQAPAARANVPDSLAGKVDENGVVTDPELAAKIRKSIVDNAPAYRQQQESRAAKSKRDQDAKDRETTGGEESGALLTGADAFANTLLLHAPMAGMAGLDTLRGISSANDKSVDSYSDALANRRAVEEARGRQHPTASTVGTVAGVAAPLAAEFLTGGLSTPVTGPIIAGAAGRVGLQAAKGAAIGATAGAVDQGFQGNYDKMGEAALTGAALGGVLGGGLPMAGRAASEFGGALRQGVDDTVAAGRGMFRSPSDIAAMAPVGERAENVVNGLSGLEQQSSAGVDAAYQKVRDSGGAFDRGAFDDIGIKFRNALDAENVRPRLAEKAFPIADDVAANLSGHARTLDHVDAERQFIGKAIDQALRKGDTEDVRGLIAIKKALDDHVDSVADRFQGPAGANVIGDLKDARKAASDHFSFFDSNDEGGRVIQKLLNTDRSLSQQEKANLLFGSDALSPSSMADASFVVQKIQQKFGDTPTGQQMINDLRIGWLQKASGEASQYSNSNLQARINKVFETRGREGADALFNTTERAAIQQSIKQGFFPDLAQRMVNSIKNTGAAPILGGLNHGIPGMGMGMAVKGLAEMANRRMVANTQRKMFQAIGALPRPAPPPPRPPIPPVPPNPNMRLPVGVGYVGGQGGGLLQ